MTREVSRALSEAIAMIKEIVSKLIQTRSAEKKKYFKAKIGWDNVKQSGELYLFPLVKIA